MKALDTNVLVRFLMNDDKTQGRKARSLFEAAERTGDRFLVTRVVLLETIWVLTAVYVLSRQEVLHAVSLLMQMPILEFEDHDATQQLVRLGGRTRADLPDLLIGLAARSRGCETTLTFDRGLQPTGLFETL